MCFVNENYDWTPSVVEIGVKTLERSKRCRECCREITAGKTVHTITMREHEECQACENYECDCLCRKDDLHDCQCENPQFGETFDYLRCEDCHKFLAAVESAEIESGCEVSEAKPSLEGMSEEIRDGGRDEAKKYFKTARRMFPELAASGFLGWLWRCIF